MVYGRLCRYSVVPRQRQLACYNKEQGTVWGTTRDRYAHHQPTTPRSAQGMIAQHNRIRLPSRL
jgi:hypothetical protein